MKRVFLVLFSLCTLSITRSHVKLVFPPPRTPYDFWSSNDELGTLGGAWCGVQQQFNPGRGDGSSVGFQWNQYQQPVTTLAMGSTFDVTWQIARPHELLPKCGTWAGRITGPVIGAKRDIGSPGECCAACYEEEECMSWEFREGQGSTCLLQSSAGEPEASDEWVYGIRGQEADVVPEGEGEPFGESWGESFGEYLMSVSMEDTSNKDIVLAEVSAESEGEGAVVIEGGSPGEPDGTLSASYREHFSVFLLDHNSQEVTLLAESSNDTTLTHLEVVLPSATCSNCVIALKAFTGEYGDINYYFKSCANVQIVGRTEEICVADCNDNGVCVRNGNCICEVDYGGPYCSVRFNCKDDPPNNGHCTHGEAYCMPGFTGPQCDVESLMHIDAIDIVESEYDQSFKPGNNDFEAHWSINEEENWIEMVIKARTDGYVAVGWKPEGLQTGSTHIMDSADMVIGMVDADGFVNVDDYWSLSRATPLRDSWYEDEGGLNDIIDFVGVEEDGWTLVKFRKSLSASDLGDHTIKNTTMILMYAFGQTESFEPEIPQPALENPEFYTPDVLLYHGGDSFIAPGNKYGGRGRGSSIVNFWDVFESCAVVPAAGYANVVRFSSSPGYLMHWLIDGESISVMLDVEGATDVWIGWGLSVDGTMTSSGNGSDAIVSFPAETPKRYNVYDYDSGGSESELPLIDASREFVDGRTRIQFTRPLEGGEPETQDVSLVGQYVIFAMGPSSKFGYHGSARGSLVVNFADSWDCKQAPEDGGDMEQVEEDDQGDVRDNEQCDKNVIFAERKFEFPSCLLSMDFGFELFWSIGDEDIEVLFRVPFNASEEGWIAFGFSNPDSDSPMIGANVVLGSSNEKMLNDYHLSSKILSGGVEPQQRQRLIELQQEVAGGYVAVRFRRYLKVPGIPPISASSGTGIVYGIGELNEYGELAKHSERVSSSLNFSTSKIESDDESLFEAHAAVLSLAFGVFIPIGIIFGRFFKRCDPFWKFIHIGFNSLGVVFLIIGFFIGVGALGSHVHTSHMAIGIIAFILCITQVFAIFRPAKSKDNNCQVKRAVWELTHHWSGRIGLILGIVNIRIGQTIKDITFGWTFAFWAIFSVIAFIYFVLELKVSYLNKTYAPLEDGKHDGDVELAKPRPKKLALVPVAGVDSHLEAEDVDMESKESHKDSDSIASNHEGKQVG